MDTKKENLRELIEKFMDSDNTQEFLEDIETGERILLEHPAPEPDDMLLANIKANIVLHKVPQRTVTFRKRFVEVLAAAASIAVIAAISLQSFFETTPVTSPKNPDTARVLPAGWWTNEDEAYVNIIDNYTKLNNQLAQIGADNYNNDALALDEFQNQIQKVQNHLVSMESAMNTQTDNLSHTSSSLDDIENKLNELSGNFWQDDYSNAEIF